MKKRIYVLDTSALLTDFKVLFSFKHHDVVIPLIVLDEIDKNKSRSDPAGKHARTICRILDSLRIKARKSKTSLLDGVKIRKGSGTLVVKDFDSTLLPTGFNPQVPDHQIIATALTEQAANPDRKVSVVSNDINLRIKCDAIGLLSEDFQTQHVVKEKSQLYSGHVELNVTSSMIDELYQQNLFDDDIKSPQLHSNQFLTLKSIENETHHALARFISEDKPLQNIKKTTKGTWGVSPKNREQTCAWELLTDPNVEIVSLAGKAGTGKTLLAVAAGLQQVLNDGKYSHLIVSRPVQPMGRDIGFLPGTLEEKMEPWLAPVQDNLRFLFGNDKATLKQYMDKGVIEVEALTYIRGRSIGNAFIIIDECQNLTRHEIKTILTRVGLGSKIVLTGDIEQIDNVNIDETSNGLSYVIEKFKDVEFAGHVSLVKGERSRVATVSSEIL